MSTGTPWTEARAAEAAKLYLGGMSATEVARALGGGFTRKAVLGKMSRMGIVKGGYGGRPGDEALRARRKVRQPSMPKVSVADILECGCATEAPSPAAHREMPCNSPVPPLLGSSLPRASSGSVPLIDLEPRDCRWVVGDPLPRSADTLFCGADRDGNSPYCEKHRREARRDLNSSVQKQLASRMRTNRLRRRAAETRTEFVGAVDHG